MEIDPPYVFSDDQIKEKEEESKEVKNEGGERIREKDRESSGVVEVFNATELCVVDGMSADMVDIKSGQITKIENEGIESDEKETHFLSSLGWFKVNKEDYCFPRNVSDEVTISDDVSSLIKSFSEVFSSDAIRLANLSPSRYAVSLDGYVPSFRKRDSWNTRFTSLVTALRLVGHNPLLNTLSVPTLQLLSDHLTVPSWLPTLPSGVSSSISYHPSGEWFFPTKSGLKIRQNAQPDRMTGRYILYIHGGAFCCCHTGTHRGLLHHLVDKTGASILSVNYRRPPEFPYPVPVDDCLSAYLFLLEKVGDARQIFFAGDSAGGNLVINTLIRIAQHGLPKPAGAVLLSPWVDLTDNGRCASWEEFSEIDYLSPTLAEVFAKSYTGDSLEVENISPLYSDALHLLPPLLVEFGQCEVLHDQIWAFCDKARQTGVDIIYNARKDMVHVFPIYAFSGMQQCKDSFDEIVSFFNERGTANEKDDETNISDADVIKDNVTDEHDFPADKSTSNA